MSDTSIAAPKRCQKWCCTCPGSPARPAHPCPRVQRHQHAGRSTRLASTARTPRLPLQHLSVFSPPASSRSSNTTLPSAPKVSAAVMQVVMPGSVESIAVSKVQSMNAPLGSKSVRSAARAPVPPEWRLRSEAPLGRHRRSWRGGAPPRRRLLRILDPLIHTPEPRRSGCRGHWGLAGEYRADRRLSRARWRCVFAGAPGAAPLSGLGLVARSSPARAADPAGPAAPRQVLARRYLPGRPAASAARSARVTAAAFRLRATDRGGLRGLPLRLWRVNACA